MLDSARAHHSAGRLEHAESIYRQVLNSEPNNPHALNLLGMIAQQRGDLTHAIALMTKSVEIDSSVPYFFSNLSQSLCSAGQLDNAVLRARQAIALDPNYPKAHLNLGAALEKLADFVGAEASYRIAVQLKPDYVLAYKNLGTVLDRLGRKSDAVEVYRKALQLRPDSEEVRYFLAAITGEPAPATAPAKYVEKLFDDYAGRFEQHLQSTLEYRSHHRLVEAVFAQSLPDRKLSVLDLGCGTGLVGELVKDRASTLVGVDLSAAMLEQARQKSIYSELRHADLLTALQGDSRQYDLILAADVFVYVGDLANIFASVKARLCAGGLFGFTTEAAEDNDAKWPILLATRRYAHSQTYLASLAQSNGFTQIHNQRSVLRKNEDVPIPGFVVVLRC